MARARRLGGQAEPLAVIILTVVGLAIALSVWAWVNASIGPVSEKTWLTQYLAYERAREYINLIASGVAPNGWKEYVVELMHIVVTERRWFAFILLVNQPGEASLINATLTEQLNNAYGTNVQVYLLKPSPATGDYIRTTQNITFITVKASDVILADGRDLTAYGLNATSNITIVMVPEYFTGVGDPTPQALVDILVNPSLLPGDSRLIIVTLTSYNNRWYEVTRLLLP